MLFCRNDAMKVLKIAFPSGSLQEATFKLFAKAGYNVRLPSRSYVPDIDDPELEGMMFRAQEIAKYVERGVVDVGLTGKDMILENNAQVVELGEMIYSKTSSRPVRTGVRSWRTILISSLTTSLPRSSSRPARTIIPCFGARSALHRRRSAAAGIGALAEDAGVRGGARIRRWVG